MACRTLQPSRGGCNTTNIPSRVQHIAGLVFWSKSKTSTTTAPPNCSPLPQPSQSTSLALPPPIIRPSIPTHVATRSPSPLPQSRSILAHVATLQPPTRSNQPSQHIVLPSKKKYPSPPSLGCLHSSSQNSSRCPTFIVTLVATPPLQTRTKPA